MIQFLSGLVVKKLASTVVLNVAGVGYGVDVPLTAFAFIPIEGENCSLWISMKVKEDSMKLYGFPTFVEKEVFEMLLNVNGVGPKMAIAILSTIPLTSLRNAIDFNQPEILENVPGIGARTAEKILLDLKGRIKKFPKLGHEDSVNKKTASGLLSFSDQQHDQTQFRLLEDLRSALENLGYKEKEINPVLQDIKSSHTDADFSQLIRVALSKLQKTNLETLRKPGTAKPVDGNLETLF